MIFGDVLVFLIIIPCVLCLITNAILIREFGRDSYGEIDDDLIIQGTLFGFIWPISIVAYFVMVGTNILDRLRERKTQLVVDAKLRIQIEEDYKKMDDCWYSRMGIDQ